jgi:uroporphyrinogen decarboxylase
MTERERVEAALRHRPTDVVPLAEFHLDDGLVAGILGLAAGATVDLPARRRAFALLGLDGIVGYPLLPDGTRLLGVNMAAGAAAREAGARDPRRRFGLPSPKALDWSEVDFFVGASPFFVFAMLPGTFSELAYLWGFEEFLMATVEEPDAVTEMASGMAAYGLELAAEAVAHGVQGFVVGDDFAWNEGLFVAPRTWRELFLPPLRQELEALASYGLPVVLHNDGRITEVLDDLAGLPLDGLQSLMPSAGMDLRQVKRDFGTRFCLWGNYDLDHIVKATPDELKALVADIFAAGSPGGGFIFGSAAGELGGDLPVGRVAELFRLAQMVRAGG